MHVLIFAIVVALAAAGVWYIVTKHNSAPTKIEVKKPNPGDNNK